MRQCDVVVFGRDATTTIRDQTNRIAHNIRILVCALIVRCVFPCCCCCCGEYSRRAHHAMIWNRRRQSMEKKCECDVRIQCDVRPNTVQFCILFFFVSFVCLLFRLILAGAFRIFMYLYIYTNRYASVSSPFGGRCASGYIIIIVAGWIPARRWAQQSANRIRYNNTSAHPHTQAHTHSWAHTGIRTTSYGAVPCRGLYIWCVCVFMKSRCRCHHRHRRRRRRRCGCRRSRCCRCRSMFVAFFRQKNRVHELMWTHSSGISNRTDQNRKNIKENWHAPKIKINFLQRQSSK